MTQVLSTGQTAAHCGAVEMADAFGAFLRIDHERPFFSEIATLGHSGSQAEQLVHCDAMIFSVIIRSLIG